MGLYLELQLLGGNWVKWGLKSGPNPIGLVTLGREEETSLPGCTHRERPREDTARRCHLQARRGALARKRRQAPRPGLPGFPNGEEARCCCRSRPACRIGHSSPGRPGQPGTEAGQRQGPGPEDTSSEDCRVKGRRHATLSLSASQRETEAACTGDLLYFRHLF